jgi:hypothetical protein
MATLFKLLAAVNYLPSGFYSAMFMMSYIYAMDSAPLAL